MPNSFYILQRFFLRVDNVVIRTYDTRIHHEAGRNYLIREYSEKESLTKDLTCPAKMFTEPNEVANFLALKRLVVEKLEFPSVDDEETSS